MRTTLCCKLQNRIGALDRLLGALTARGFIPERFVSGLDPAGGTMQVVFTFSCPGDKTEADKTLEKLIKALYKQVYVLEIQLLMPDEDEPVWGSPSV
jgi:acetolactate synthase small subunit